MNGYTSQQIYDRIVREAKHKKSIKALSNVKDACDFLQKQDTGITVSRVAGFCSGRDGGPKAQSILNNKSLSNYVIARRAEQTLPIKPTQEEPEIRTGNALCDGYIAGLQAELRIAQRRENQLRGIFRRQAEESGGFDLDESLKQDRFVAKGASAPPAPPVPADLVAVLKKFLNPTLMESLGFVQEDGCIFSPEHNDKALLTKREVDCIQRVINGQAST